jgi:wyosine [tRNA(Phe)-imidazoG37] synthetase (radical SAM superfamily)
MKTFIKKDPLLQSIRDAAEIGVKSIGFIGDGEPTCNPYVWEALKLGKSVGLDLSISTNGVLLNTEGVGEVVWQSQSGRLYLKIDKTKTNEDTLRKLIGEGNLSLDSTRS